jgi:hypothetical protein
MKILRFLVGRLRNEEWFRFHTEYYGLVILYTAELLGIKRIFLLYEALLKEADRLLELLQASFSTTGTAEADYLRTEMFKGLRDAVKSFLHSIDSQTQTAAKKLHTVITKYGSAIMKGGRAAKTAAIDNLLQDLTHGESLVDLSAEVQLLDLGQWVTNLNDANVAFKESLAERAGEAADRPEAGRLIQVRAAMDSYYIHMINSIDTLLIGIYGGEAEEEEEEEEEDNGPVEERDTPLPDGNDEKIIRFAKELNVYITHYRALLKGRQTRKNKEQ